MTRKHFVAIAEILKSHNASEEMVSDFAYLMATLNPRFDRGKFVNAAMR